MTRKLTLLNFAAVALFLFMVIDRLAFNHENNNGWGIFAILMCAGFSSLLIVIDYFIQIKIKNQLKLFLVELAVLFIIIGIGIATI